ncbi:SDR family oxidoreductase [Nostocoides sp. HKS02]|uniref:SDR family oxidoreductase n=1 Tax=Nostocoides sp. HKS02 TaxID=1813880 RepID=UPI0012B462A1|nr:SDR family oxidoreductase [Tetrasphaera sp. HKS02]QGN58504.1 NAD(P)H-binding protein [Tetrasphaera sp. HKS02]
MILVAGGSGLLGSRLATDLCARGHAVRVLSRGLTPLSRPLPDQVEVVHGDVRDRASISRAMAGVDQVVSAVQGFAGPGGGTPATVDLGGNLNLIAEAEARGASFVLISVLGAAADSPMELFRAKYAAEQRLRAATCPWTIIRPDASAETWVGLMDQTAGSAHRPLVFGRGDNPIAWVSVDDVVALTVRVVTDDSLRGRTLEICGPQQATLRELASMVMAQRGWPGHPRRIPRPVLHLMAAVTSLVRPQLARQARASLAMDSLPTARDDALRAEFPDLPRIPVSDIVARTVSIA